MTDGPEINWRFYKENMEHARHHETLRANITNMILLLSGIGFSVVGYDKLVTNSDIPLLIFLFILGIFWAAFSIKQAERARIHLVRAELFRNEIDENVAKLNITKIYAEANDIHSKDYYLLTKFKLWMFWVLIHMSISIIALGLFVIWYFN
jgi:hypothetical protein